MEQLSSRLLHPVSAQPADTDSVPPVFSGHEAGFCSVARLWSTKVLRASVLFLKSCCETHVVLCVDAQTTVIWCRVKSSKANHLKEGGVKRVWHVSCVCLSRETLCGYGVVCVCLSVFASHSTRQRVPTEVNPDTPYNNHNERRRRERRTRSEDINSTSCHETPVLRRTRGSNHWEGWDHHRLDAHVLRGWLWIQRLLSRQ